MKGMMDILFAKGLGLFKKNKKHPELDKILKVGRQKPADYLWFSFKTKIPDKDIFKILYSLYIPGYWFRNNAMKNIFGARKVKLNTLKNWMNLDSSYFCIF